MVTDINDKIIFHEYYVGFDVIEHFQKTLKKLVLLNDTKDFKQYDKI